MYDPHRTFDSLKFFFRNYLKQSFHHPESFMQLSSYASIIVESFCQNQKCK